ILGRLFRGSACSQVSGESSQANPDRFLGQRAACAPGPRSRGCWSSGLRFVDEAPSSSRMLATATAAGTLGNSEFHHTTKGLCIRCPVAKPFPPEDDEGIGMNQPPWIAFSSLLFNSRFSFATLLGIASCRVTDALVVIAAAPLCLAFLGLHPLQRENGSRSL